MKIIKNINNNVVICQDSSGTELIAFGKGIGFRKPPCNIDIKDIERTYYNLDYRYISLLESIDENTIEISISVRDYARKLNILTNENLVFSLADHITFAIERLKKGISFELPIANDIRQMFPKEIEIGKYALQLIQEKLGQTMPEEESIYIALDIINSEQQVNNNWIDNSNLVSKIMNVISENMNVKINKNSFLYSRFVSHLYYLFQRTDVEETMENRGLLKSIQFTNPNEYKCSMKIKELVDQTFKTSISNDEVLYLTLHISRLCDRSKEELS